MDQQEDTEPSVVLAAFLQSELYRAQYCTEESDPDFYVDEYFAQIDILSAENHMAIEEVAPVLETYLPLMFRALDGYAYDAVNAELYRSWLGFLKERGMDDDALVATICRYGADLLEQEQQHVLDEERPEERNHVLAYQVFTSSIDAMPWLDGVSAKSNRKAQDFVTTYAPDVLINYAVLTPDGVDRDYPIQYVGKPRERLVSYASRSAEVYRDCLEILGDGGCDTLYEFTASVQPTLVLAALQSKHGTRLVDGDEDTEILETDTETAYLLHLYSMEALTTQGDPDDIERYLFTASEPVMKGLARAGDTDRHMKALKNTTRLTKKWPGLSRAFLEDAGPVGISQMMQLGKPHDAAAIAQYMAQELQCDTGKTMVISDPYSTRGQAPMMVYYNIRKPQEEPPEEKHHIALMFANSTDKVVVDYSAPKIARTADVVTDGKGNQVAAFKRNGEDIGIGNEKDRRKIWQSALTMTARLKEPLPDTGRRLGTYVRAFSTRQLLHRPNQQDSAQPGPI